MIKLISVKLRCSLLFVLIFFSGKNLYSQRKTPPLITDRPDKTESPNSVVPGFIQFETGFLYEKTDFEQLNYKLDAFTLGSSLLRIGLIKNLELRFGGEYLVNKFTIDNSTQNINGINAVNAGVKFQFLEESNQVPASAFIIEVELPVGEPDLRPSEAEPVVIFSISRTVGTNGSTGLNIGAFSNSYTKKIDYLFTYTFGYNFDTNFGMFLEYFGFFVPATAPLHNIDGGLTYLLMSNLQLDVSGGTKLNGEGNYWFISSGLTIRLPR